MGPPRKCVEVDKPIETIRGNIINCRGLGWQLLMSVMEHNGAAPSRRIVEEAVAALKSSGEHDRIIAAVGAELASQSLGHRPLSRFQGG